MRAFDFSFPEIRAFYREKIRAGNEPLFKKMTCNFFRGFHILVSDVDYYESHIRIPISFIYISFARIKLELVGMPAKKAKATEVMTVKKGDTVKVHYTGSLEDGTVFDSSESHGTPLEFQVGAGQVIPGFENAMVGMKKDEEKEIKLSVSEAYGEYNPQMVRKVPKAQLPKDQEPKVGMILIVGLPNGMQVPVKIVAVDAESVSIDLNHPLAGKALNFKIKIVGIGASK
jgi:FKBP-type peptidyl-prolyl cis-trans isomerase 2